MSREEVRLNIYDMCSFNSYTSAIGVGVFHSGVQVYNTEYGYGGHPFNVSGVFEIEPKDEESLGDDNFKYKETVLIGYTDFADDEIRELVNQTGKEFRGDQYHLLHKNCNHFTDNVCKILCGKGIPSWVNRLAYISTCVPFLERCLPKEFLTPIVLEEKIQETVKSRSNSINISNSVNDTDNGSSTNNSDISTSSNSNNSSSSSSSSTNGNDNSNSKNIIYDKKSIDNQRLLKIQYKTRKYSWCSKLANYD